MRSGSRSVSILSPLFSLLKFAVEKTSADHEERITKLENQRPLEIRRVEKIEKYDDEKINTLAKELEAIAKRIAELERKLAELLKRKSALKEKQDLLEQLGKEEPRDEKQKQPPTPPP